VAGTARVRIAYIVQDLSDPAVARRVSMLRAGGAEVDLYGFRRTDAAPALVADVIPHDLGRTSDGKLWHRALAVAARTLSVGKWARGLKEADVILARNLESLVLGIAAKTRLKSRARLIYELLDVHTVMLGKGPASRFLRTVEDRALAGCDATIVSSPAFERCYLAVHHPDRPETLLVENKVFGAPSLRAPLPARAPGPPWRIGWFGGIRCRRSLECLSLLTHRLPGLFEVELRGRFANTDLGDVEALLRESPGMSYLGPYQNPDDLPHIYGGVHFAWAIDFYEEGANSSWLLPNRLYEGALYGAVPIALSSVETGRWLAQHGVGWLVDTPLEESVGGLLQSMTQARYRQSFDALQALDPRLFRSDEQDCRDLVRRIGPPEPLLSTQMGRRGPGEGP
jgi:succinoglycan biosynthesis protein ExoL